jgi:dGTPase
LFEFYMSHPDRLPENYAEASASAPLHRVVCDYIAGMTDGFFLRCYQQNLGG